MLKLNFMQVYSRRMCITAISFSIYTYKCTIHIHMYLSLSLYTYSKCTPQYKCAYSYRFIFYNISQTNKRTSAKWCIPMGLFKNNYVLKSLLK